MRKNQTFTNAPTIMPGFKNIQTQRISAKTNYGRVQKRQNLDSIRSEQLKVIPDTTDPDFQPSLRAVKQLNPKYVEYTQENNLYTDRHFTPEMALPNYQNLKSNAKIYWLRPYQISEDPVFSCNKKLMHSAGAASRSDINQGEVADCWFLATLATVALKSELLERCLPEERNQTFDFQAGYNGKFTFSFYYFGDWVDVSVDDRLPVVVYPNGTHTLYGCSSDQPNEFWSALFEKAYAKFNGGYHVLNGGNSNQAMVDLTGGATEERDVAHEISKREDHDYKILFRQIQKYCNRDDRKDKTRTDLKKDRRDLVTTSISVLPGQALEDGRSDGLYVGHSYSFIDCHVVKLKSRKEIMSIRLRNPWGSDIWHGQKQANEAFSAKEMSEWDQILQAKDQEDKVPSQGEFWIPLAVYVRIFHKINICRISAYHYRAEGSWNTIEANLEWSEENKTCGGLKKLSENPYIPVELSGGEKSDQMILILQHRFTRQMKIDNLKENQHLTYNPIGFVVYEMDPNSEIVQTKTIHQIRAERPSLRDLINTRNRKSKVMAELTWLRDYTKCLKKLKGGKYVVIPISIKSGTDKSGQEGNFYIRVWSEKDN